MNRSHLIAGIVGGLVAGLVFGALMSMMSAPTPDGKSMPLMAMIGMVVRSPTVIGGWLYHLFNSALIGAIFAALLGGRVTGYSAGLLWGAVYGVAWWVLGGLILMPVLLGMPAFAPLTVMTGVAMGSLVGHLIYGLILGAAFVWLAERQAGAAVSSTRSAAHATR
jgi:uncharacterized membrane protein YagU involved in acid resistance